MSKNSRNVTNEKPDLSVAEVAEIVGVCARTIRELYHDGALPGAYRLRRRLRIPHRTLELLRSRTEAQR